jgi:hypothetical protein
VRLTVSLRAEFNQVGSSVSVRHVPICLAAIVCALSVLGFVPSVAANASSSGPSGKQVSAGSYTHSLCASLSSWEATIKSSSAGLQGQLTGSGTVPATRTILVQFLNQAADTTTMLITSVDHAGTPKVKQGKALAKFLHNSLQQVERLFSNSARQAQALPDDPQGFSSGAKQLGNSIDNAGTQIQNLFATADLRFTGAAALDKAFHADPACSSIGP